MASGFYSPLPLLGLGSAPLPVQAGFKSPLSLLGLSSVQPITTQAGCKSLFAFWMGGACTFTPSPTPPSPAPSGGPTPVHLPVFHIRQHDDEDVDDDILELVSLILSAPPML